MWSSRGQFPNSLLVRKWSLFLKLRDWQLVTLQNWTTLPLFKQNVFPERGVGEPHYQFPAFLSLASRRCYECKCALPVSIQLSWPLNLFMVTQGPEQEALLYINGFIQCKRLFGTNIPFPSGNRAAWGNIPRQSENRLQQPLNECFRQK